MIERTAQAETKIDAGGSVPAEGGHGRQTLGGCAISEAGVTRTSSVTGCEWPAWAGRRHIATRQSETEEEMGPYRKSRFRGIVTCAPPGLHGEARNLVRMAPGSQASPRA